MSTAQYPKPTHPLAQRFRGPVLNTRPFFQRLQNTPPIRVGIAASWVAWLATGWALTATTTATAATVIAAHSPWLAVLALAAGIWTVGIERHRHIAALIAIASTIGLVLVSWFSGGMPLRVLMVLPAAAWAADLALGALCARYRLRRWWCELRRGFPIRYAIMAAKSTRIQGAIDGEQQLGGGRPILDHPALARIPQVDGNTVWAVCTVPPGRNAAALQDVIHELAASFVKVKRIDLVFADNFHTYGWLVITFNDTPTPARKLKPVGSADTITARIRDRIQPTKRQTATHAGNDINEDPGAESAPRLVLVRNNNKAA